MNNNQVLVGNGTNTILQNPNLIWDNTSNGLGIGTTQLFNPTTSFQVNNRSLVDWVQLQFWVLKIRNRNNRNILQMIENIELDCRTHIDGQFN